MLAKRSARRLETMLQDHAKGDASIGARADQLIGTLARNLQRLFEQNMLTGACQGGNDLEVRVGRRQHRRDLNIAVLQHRFEAVAQGKGEALGKRLAAAGWG